VSEAIQRSDPSGDLLQRVGTLPFVRGAIEELAASTPAPLLKRAFESALEAGGPDAARNLGFALAARGERIPYEPLARLAFETGALVVLMPLIARVDGDSVELILDAVEGDLVSHEQKATALCFAFELSGRKASPRLVAALRGVARATLPPHTGFFVGVAAQLSGDPALVRLSHRLAPPLPKEKLEKLAAEFVGDLSLEPLRAVPEKEPPRGVDYTVVRTAPRVGRNDPCPCGSGRKYKKCCADKSEQDAAHVPLLERFEQLGDEHRQVRGQIFRVLGPFELAHVSLDRLSTGQIIDGMRRLAEARRWRDAERFADALENRADLPGGAQAHEYHWEIAMGAFEAGALDVAQHHFERSRPSESDRAEIDTDLALARHDPDALDRLEARLLGALRAENQGQLVDTAHTLLQTHPALGLLVARAVIDPDRDLESEMLLSVIDEVRDRLLLDPEEPWREIYDLLIARRDERAAREEAWEANDQEREALSEEVHKLREELRQASEQTQLLTAELRQRRDDLESLAREREELSGIVAASLGGDGLARQSEREAEKLRLRERIDALEKQISAGNEQRAEMRRQLKRLAVERPSPPIEAREIAGPQDTEPEERVVPPRFVLVPSYSPAAAKTIASLPRHVAAQALRGAAALAAGDEHEWKGVKRMRATANVHSARLGRSHRLLFRFGDGAIEVLDVVDRKDLDAAVARYV
jgi:hypothetical protein